MGMICTQLRTICSQVSWGTSAKSMVDFLRANSLTQRLAWVPGKGWHFWAGWKCLTMRGTHPIGAPPWVPAPPVELCSLLHVAPLRGLAPPTARCAARYAACAGCHAGPWCHGAGMALDPRDGAENVDNGWEMMGNSEWTYVFWMKHRDKLFDYQSPKSNKLV